MINFLRYRYLCAVGSVVMIAAGVVGYINHNGFNYHIDFVGGTELQVSFADKLEAAALRSALSDAKWEEPVIQSVGSNGNQFLIRVKQNEESIESAFLKAVNDKLPENKASVDNVSWVGAEVGNDIKWNAFLAILLSLLGILLYIIFRSEFRFGVGAIVALAHDLLAVLVAVLIFNEQMSLGVLAAILTTLGYSINDTIVIFSRIKENFVKLKGRSEEEIVNISLNETMRRTLLTSLTTFLATAAIFLIGGEALRGLSLSLLVGIVAGTYSSIYIASPVMLAIGRRESRKAAAHVR